MRCFGYAIDWRDRDSVAIRGGRWPLVAGVLAASSEPVVTDSSRGADAAPVECTVPTIGRVDTLLLARTGRVVALRLHRLAPAARCCCWRTPGCCATGRCATPTPGRSRSGCSPGPIGG